jgi:hypothetical protein
MGREALTLDPIIQKCEAALSGQARAPALEAE